MFVLKWTSCQKHFIDLLSVDEMQVKGQAEIRKMKNLRRKKSSGGDEETVEVNKVGKEPD